MVAVVMMVLVLWNKIICYNWKFTWCPFLAQQMRRSCLQSSAASNRNHQSMLRRCWQSLALSRFWIRLHGILATVSILLALALNYINRGRVHMRAIHIFRTIFLLTRLLSIHVCLCVYYAKQTQKMVYCSSKSVSKPVTHDKITATCRIAIYHWYWYYKQILLRTGKHSVLVTNLLKTRKTKYKHTRTLTLKWTPNGSFTRVQINVHHKSCSHTHDA